MKKIAKMKLNHISHTLLWRFYSLIKTNMLPTIYITIQTSRQHLLFNWTRFTSLSRRLFTTVSDNISFPGLHIWFHQLLTFKVLFWNLTVTKFRPQWLVGYFAFMFIFLQSSFLLTLIKKSLQDSLSKLCSSRFD